LGRKRASIEHASKIEYHHHQKQSIYAYAEGRLFTYPKRVEEGGGGFEMVH
jgi:hypothetical protein